MSGRRRASTASPRRHPNDGPPPRPPVRSRCVPAAHVVTVSIEVAWIDLDPGAGELRGLARLLTDDDRARVAARATPALRRRATVSLAHRRLLAAEVLGASPSAVALRVAADGRRLASSSPRSDTVAISVSTSGDTGLVAVASTGAVGVDVEDFDGVPPSPAFIERAATPAERASLEVCSGEDRERAVRSLWSRKEAYLKATGEGIGVGLQRVEVPLETGAWGRRWEPVAGACWYLYDLDVPRPGLAAAVVAGPAGSAEEIAPVLRVRPA